MKSLRAILVFVAATALLLAPAWAARAEEPDPDEEGVPAYSVARLIVRQGSVWVLSPDSGDWEEYEQNTPVGPRTRLSVPEGSEAELQFHGGQFMLLTGGTEIDIRYLAEKRSSFRLRSGEIRFDLPEADFSPVRVAVPGDRRVELGVPGKYWLLIEGGDARLVVRRGAATAIVGRQEFKVREGEEAVIGDDVKISRHVAGPEKEAPPPPLSEEERRSGLPPAAVYELREYGEWVYTPEYGVVWRPRVAPGWTPYFYGRWAWISPFGWTWISYEPWGWYPYHFGWWYADPFFGWVWCPFRTFVSVNIVVGRPFLFHRDVFFVPATVRFVHDGRRVRWVPLRPGERFVRPAFTRAETRLVTWDRPLERGKVFVRQEKDGARHWRDWAEVRAERRPRGPSGVGQRAERRLQGRDERPGGGGGRESVEAPHGRGPRVPSQVSPGGEGRMDRPKPQPAGPGEEDVGRPDRKGRPERERRPAGPSLRDGNGDSRGAEQGPALPPSRLGPLRGGAREADKGGSRAQGRDRFSPDRRRDYGGGGMPPPRPPLAQQGLERGSPRALSPSLIPGAGAGAVSPNSPAGRGATAGERRGPGVLVERDPAIPPTTGGGDAFRSRGEGERRLPRESSGRARDFRGVEGGGRWGEGREGGFGAWGRRR